MTRQDVDPQSMADFAKESQLDFELRFFGSLARQQSTNLDVLRLHARNLVANQQIVESMRVAQKIAEYCPSDIHAHYNLACGYSLLRQADAAITELRAALELGYRDFKYILEDPDLEFLRQDSRFGKLLREFAT